MHINQIKNTLKLSLVITFTIKLNLIILYIRFPILFYLYYFAWMELETGTYSEEVSR